MTPTFYIEKPHPAPEMFGVLGYERIKREHAKAWAAATPEVRAEAKQYADRVLRSRSWSRPAVPKRLLTEHESKRLRLWINGSTDYTEELVASARVLDPGDLFMPTETCGCAPGTGIVEDNLDQTFPPMPECLQEHDCPNYRVQRPLNIPDCIVISSDNSSTRGDDLSESEESPIPSKDKGKGVDRGIAAPEIPDCIVVASPDASCTNNDCPGVDVPSTIAVDKGESVEKGLATCKAITKDSTGTHAAHALSVVADSHSSNSASVHGNTRRAHSDPGTSNHASLTTICFSEDISTSTTPLAQESTAASPESMKKVYTCRWSKYFGGSCNYTSNTAQSHDRHVITHIPDEDGYQVTQHRCTICCREFARKCSFQRHVKCVHKNDNPDECWEEATRPWYWPEVFFISESMKAKPRAESPLGNDLTCLERIGQILGKHGIVSAMRRAGDEGVITNIPCSSSRPTKRQKIG